MPQRWQELGTRIHESPAKIASYCFVDFKQGIHSNYFQLHYLRKYQAVEGISTNASKQQDNVLIEYLTLVRFEMILFDVVRYECAILLNKLFNVPVFPVFLAEIEMKNGNKEFARFNNKATFPDVPHLREESSQLIIDELQYVFLYSTFFFSLFFPKNEILSVFTANICMSPTQHSLAASAKP